MHRQTLDAIVKQINAMGCAEYELGVMDDKGFFDQTKGKHQARMHLRPRPDKKNGEAQLAEAGSTGAEVAADKPATSVPCQQGITDAEIMTKYMPWLGRMNANGGAEGNGCHIFVRPYGPTNLTFIDDLKRPTVEKMTQDGFQFAVLIESSPDNFHGWLKHHETLSPEEETVAAQTLCALYGGDPGAASKRRFGRLAGFTNRKDKYRDESLDRNGAGGFPFVKIHEASGQTFTKADEFLAQVRTQIQNDQQNRNKQSEQSHQYQKSFQGRENRIKDISYFQRKLSQKGERYAADFQYALHALGNGKSEIEVEHIIRTQSQSGSNRGNYPQRTVRKVREFQSRKGQSQSHQSSLAR